MKGSWRFIFPILVVSLLFQLSCESGTISGSTAAVDDETSDDISQTTQRLTDDSKVAPHLVLKNGVIKSMRLRHEVDGDTSSLKSFMTEFEDLFKIEDADSSLEDWRYSKYSDSGVNVEHLTLRQAQSGIPIFGSEAVFHLRDGELVGISANYTNVEDKVFYSSTPALSAEQILARVSEVLEEASSNESYTFHLLGDLSLVYYDPSLFESESQRNSNFVASELSCSNLLNVVYLTYLMFVSDENGTRYIFADANSGMIRKEIPMVNEAINLDIETGDHRPQTNFYSNTCFVDAFTPWDDNVYDENGLISGATALTDATTANNVIFDIYDYFDNNFGWLSFNGNDMQVEIVTEVDDEEIDDHDWRNAVWDPGCKHIQMGDNTVSIDILGHEYTHGIIDYSSNLVYERESGALNESYADIFGATIKQADGSSTWYLLGENTVFAGSGSGIRNLQDPPDEDQPDHIIYYQSNDGNGLTSWPTSTKCDGDNDYCGVHNNSGIPNKAYYLMTTGGTHTWKSGGGVIIIPMGFSKASELYFEVMTDGLTSTADFDEAAAATINLAQDKRDDGIFTNQDVCTVINSLYAVGMTDDPDANCDGTADVGQTDTDLDLIFDLTDNCPQIANTFQEDLDADGDGDACDNDDDGDGVIDTLDNCPKIANADQLDTDGDGEGEVCQDTDEDGVIDFCDNCVSDYNPDQEDLDGDGEGDACDSDDDGDLFPDFADNCEEVANADQADTDSDSIGDVCDNCVEVSNIDQEDNDSDGVGDACDDDDDNDGVLDVDDNCPDIYNPNQLDIDGDGLGVECDDLETITQKFVEGVEIPMTWSQIDLPQSVIDHIDPLIIRFPLQLNQTSCSFCPNTVPIEGYDVALTVSMPIDFYIEVKSLTGERIVFDESVSKEKTLEFVVTPMTTQNLVFSIVPLGEIEYDREYPAQIQLTNGL